MADQISLQGAPLVIAPANTDTTPIHPSNESFGPGSVDDGVDGADGSVAGAGSRTGVGDPPISGTGDRGGPDPLATP